MKFDSQLPIHLRIAKRRRLKRVKFCSTAAGMVVVILIIWHSGILPGKVFNVIINGLSNSRNVNGASDYDKSKAAGAVDARPGEGTGSQDNSGINSLRNELEDYIRNISGTYGVYYIDLINGTEFGINDREEYLAASTFKIPVNLYLYKKIASHSIDPDSILAYMEEDYEGGTGSIQYEELGKQYSIRELSRLSITVSDNVATNMLLRKLGKRNVRDYMRELGGSVVDYEQNISCPRDMALYMREVYEFYNDDRTLGTELMDSFENTVFNERIPKLLPENLRIAHKIGNQVKAFHDVGIVFADKPYIIAIMSKETAGEAEAYNVIANISEKVYNYITEKK